jgi:periplasmic protein TonB
MVVDNRRFHYAIAASLALHAALLFGLPDLIDTARRVVSSPPPILARLMEPEPAPAPAEPPQAKKVEPVTPPPRIAKPAPQKVVPEVRAPQPTPQIETPAPEAPAPVAAPPPPVAAVAPQQSTTSSLQQAPAQAAPGLAADTVSRDQYRVQLIDEARRHKRYPPLARENNWQGNVRVGVAIAANGRPSVTLKGSSGYEVLDRQALEMFTQAARAVPVPPALRGKEFALEVGAVYGLED